MTEIFRAGIQAIPRGRDRGRSGAGHDRPPGRCAGSCCRRRARIVIPAIGNEFIAMIKDSALVAYVGIQETYWRASTTGSAVLQVVRDAARGRAHLLGPDDRVLDHPGADREAPERERRAGMNPGESTGGLGLRVWSMPRISQSLAPTGSSTKLTRQPPVAKFGRATGCFTVPVEVLMSSLTGASGASSGRRPPTKSMTNRRVPLSSPAPTLMSAVVAMGGTTAASSTNTGDKPGDLRIGPVAIGWDARRPRCCHDNRFWREFRQAAPRRCPNCQWSQSTHSDAVRNPPPGPGSRRRRDGVARVQNHADCRRGTR